jgi:O-antigen ligase
MTEEQATSPRLGRAPGFGGFAALPGRARAGPHRLLVLYGCLIGPLLVGYLLFDKAFAYVHLPGTPLYIGDIILAVGGLAALTATGYFLTPVREEPILALLAAFVLWGLIRFAPGFGTYGIDAVRDSALWYYCLYAFFVPAAMARSPDLLERLVTQLGRFTPWLLLWLPISVVPLPLGQNTPLVPGTDISILTHKSGDAAIAAFLALAFLWLFPDGRSARSRGVWSALALIAILLASTQNRGGLLGVAAGTAIGLTFLGNGLRLALKAVGVVALGLVLTATLALELPIQGAQGRAFSASQLVANVASLGGGEEGGNLSGTVEGRQVLWTRVYEKQVRDGLLVYGSGFGPNLAKQVGWLDAGTDKTRNPHNSHLDILARMGLVGLFLWVGLWACWYWRMMMGCHRLAQRALHRRRRVAVLCLSVTTTILVSSFFDPQLEGPQIAILLWTLFGVGVAVTSLRGWFGGDSRGIE